MNTWEVIIYEGSGVYNWKANEKGSDCKIPVFGKTFSNEIETKKDWKRYADSVGIENFNYITEKSKEEK